MRTLIILAHPVPESYNSALLARFVAGLEDAEVHDIEIADLNAGDDPTVEQLAQVELLAFVYPTWWGGFPAILLEWVQRRIGPWIDGAETGPSPVRNVRQLVAVTTHGSDKFVNGAVQGEPGRQLLSRGIAQQCHRSVDVEWIALYALDKLEQTGRDEFLNEVHERAAAL